MINYDSILSAFDGKPTLLQWLKMVKKALDESILKNVGITQNGEKVVFTFNFEDGTSISTPEVTLPKGDKGDKGDTGATGPKGNDGVSITGINTVSNEVVGDETLTTLRAHYSNDTTGDFVVTAKNGNGSTIYTHLVTLKSESIKLSFKVISTKETLTLNDAFEQIPDIDYASHIQSKKIPACYADGSKLGVVTIGKYTDSGSYRVNINGVIINGENIEHLLVVVAPNSIEDTLMGVNL